MLIKSQYWLVNNLCAYNVKRFYKLHIATQHDTLTNTPAGEFIAIKIDCSVTGNTA